MFMGMSGFICRACRGHIGGIVAHGDHVGTHRGHVGVHRGHIGGV